ncbi:MAG: efflux RND transporter periplasmic adaptor subunit [Desulfobulbaceae bacterium]|nr:efflux RND transporter periplasmic adaptor subunit [Desulfobulbaceae bacterium]
MKTETDTSHRPRKLLFGMLILLLAAAGFILWNRWSAAIKEESPAETITFTAQKGPLTISVIESGTIKAREQVIIKSEVEGRATILWLIEEGKRVEKDDLLLELDASRLQNALIDQQIRVQNAEANFIRARENLDVVKNQAESDIAKAELNKSFAGQDLKKYSEGEFPKELKDAESRITVAKEELRRAEEKSEWSRILYEEKYLSQTELQGDELAAKKARLDLDLAEANLNLLKEYTNARKLAELESDVKQTKMALERVRRKASADIVQAEADLLAKKSEFQREQSKLDKAIIQIKKTKIYAPADGMVIYATTSKGGWRGNADPLAAGQEVSERQELIHLPKTALMLAEVKVHESSLDKVKVGLPVKITVDAVSDQSYTGGIVSISPLPDAASLWLNPDLKLYTIIIHLDENSGNLRTGMSCRAEIVVEHYEEAVYVPIQAVIRIDNRPAVYVRSKGSVRPRPVETGLDNNRMVRIISGLEPGEEVLLTPPLL